MVPLGEKLWSAQVWPSRDPDWQSVLLAVEIIEATTLTEGAQCVIELRN